MGTYAISQSVRVSVTFTASNLNYDPATVVVYVKSPKGVATTYIFGTDAAVQKDATGQYHLDVTPTSAGAWAYRWEGTSPTNGNIAAESLFTATASQFYS